MSRKVHPEGWEAVHFKDGERHVIPLGDLRGHDEYSDCWCGPSEEVGNIWVHHSLDRREIFEEAPHGLS